MGEIHLRIQENLMKVHADVKKWKMDNYKKQIVTGCKEAKQFEDDFKKASDVKWRHTRFIQLSTNIG